MEWSEEEARDARQKGDAANRNDGAYLLSLESVRAIMTRAVELAAARGGTMTARDAKALRTALVDGTGIPHMRECLAAALDDLSALGARNAVLEASEKVWRQRVEKAADLLVDVLPGEVGRIDLVARIRALRAERDDLRQRLAVLEAENKRLKIRTDALNDAGTWVQCTTVSNDCLGGCRSMKEHDRYRHQQLSRDLEEALAFEALNEDMTRIKREIEAERDDLRLRLTALEVAGAKLSAHVDKTAGQEISEEAVEALTRRNEVEDAMRAKCILIVDEEMMTDGLSGCPIHRRIKERMKGAAT